MTERLKEKYTSLLPELKTVLKKDNALALPKINKVVVNAGLGRVMGDEKQVQAFVDDLTRLTGQKAVTTKAKKAVSGFKVRENEVIGAIVTLRGVRMYEFLDRLISVALPRSRDFRGLSRSAFAGGSYSIGISEHTIFPEIAAIGKNPLPLQVTIVTNTKNPDKARILLERLGLPFKKEEK